MDTILTYMIVGVIVTILIVLLVFLIFFTKLGFFDEVRIAIKKTQQYIYFHKDIKKNYHTLIPTYTDIGQQISKYSPLAKLQQNSMAFILGLFYDNPMQVVDRKECRCSVGIALFESEVTDEIKLYLTKLGYTSCIIPSSAAIFSSYKFVTNASIALGAMKIYKPLMKYAFTNSLCKTQLMKADVICMEIYKSSAIEYWIPFENNKEFFLTKDPAPLKIMHKKTE